MIDFFLLNQTVYHNASLAHLNHALTGVTLPLCAVVGTEVWEVLPSVCLPPL